MNGQAAWNGLKLLMILLQANIHLNGLMKKTGINLMDQIVRGLITSVLGNKSMIRFFDRHAF